MPDLTRIIDAFAALIRATSVQSVTVFNHGDTVSIDFAHRLDSDAVASAHALGVKLDVLGDNEQTWLSGSRRTDGIRVGVRGPMHPVSVTANQDAIDAALAIADEAVAP